tara:strand:- start:540 stop:935 length:396 start_codon:yes stop_codon:yes gene_type:complete
MAEKIGEFSMEHVVSSYSRNTNGDIVSTTDWRGSGSSTTLGSAQVFGSFISAAPLSESNAKSGEIEFIGESFLENGTQVGSVASGTWEKAESEHAWKIVMDGENSLGHQRRFEGTVDLETLVFKGEIYSLD